MFDSIYKTRNEVMSNMDSKLIGNENDIIFYTDEDGNTKIQVILQNEDVWLNAQAIAELFDVQRPAITKHINNIYLEQELEEKSTCSKMEHMGNMGNQKYETKYYNLDMIISIGYRVNSKKAVKFRQWASKVIKEYIIKGFALDDERFLKGGKVNQQYFDELLERIKVIRTAAELIYERADSKKENMGLTTWKEAPEGMIYKYDVSIAKNYLTETELRKLNNLTTLFLDYAESMAEENQVMTMKDWISETDNLLKFRKKEILQNSGKISHKQAIEKADQRTRYHCVLVRYNHLCF